MVVNVTGGTKTLKKYSVKFTMPSYSFIKSAYIVKGSISSNNYSSGSPSGTKFEYGTTVTLIFECDYSNFSSNYTAGSSWSTQYMNGPTV